MEVVFLILLIAILVLLFVNMSMTGGAIETVEQLKCAIKHHDHPASDPEVKELFNLIINKQELIMATFAELKQEFESLKTAISEERVQITAKLDELNNTIDQLETNIQQGGTVEERADLLSGMRDQVATVKAIIPDPATPPVDPEEEPQ